MCVTGTLHTPPLVSLKAPGCLLWLLLNIGPLLWDPHPRNPPWPPYRIFGGKYLTIQPAASLCPCPRTLCPLRPPAAPGAGRRVEWSGVDPSPQPRPRPEHGGKSQPRLSASADGATARPRGRGVRSWS